MIGNQMNTNQNLNALVTEAKSIQTAYKSGTMTNAQKNRLRTINEDIQMAQSEHLLDQLNSGTESKGNTGLESKTVLTTASLKTAARDLAGQITERAGADSERKSLVTAGTFDAPLSGMEVVGNHSPLIDRNVWSALPLRVRHETSYGYLQQTTREHNAGTVADGALKPVSDYQMEPAQGSLRVLAHLSSPLPEMLLSDNDALAQFVANEMLTGLMVGLDKQILAGDGVSDTTVDNIVGLANTSGVLSIAPDTADVPVLNLIRKAVTAVMLAGGNATHLIISPQDFEEIDLTQISDGSYLAPGAPWSSTNAETTKPWGLSVIVSSGVEPGMAYVFDANALQLSTDTQGVRLAVTNQAGELFQRNQLMMRAEGRFNLDVLYPRSIAKVHFAPVA